MGFVSFPVVCAFVRALAVKSLELAEIHKLPVTQRPNLKEFVYWVPFLVLPLIGGFLAYVYIESNTTLTPLLALNVGVTAPLVFRSMAERIPNKVIEPGAGA